MPDNETPTLSAARVAALILGAPSIVLGAALAAIYALTPAANKAIYFTSGTVAALMDMPAAARTFIASFPTPAFAASLAMGANKITGLAAATVAGDAVRYEQARIDPGTLPTVAGYTGFTATNHAVASLDLSGNRGMAFRVTSSTATARLSGFTKTCTRYAVRTAIFQAGVAASTAPSGSGCVAAARGDGRYSTVELAEASGRLVFYGHLWTSKDAIGAAPTGMIIRYVDVPGWQDMWLVGDATVAGTLTWYLSPDPTDMTCAITIWTGTSTQAFGTAGDATGFGPAALTAANNEVYFVIAHREVAS